MTLNILWLARTIPFPLESGDRIYTAGLVRSLGEHTAIHFMGVGRPEEVAAARRFAPRVKWTGLDARLRSKISSLMSSRPFVSARFSSGEIINAVAGELGRQRYDVVVLDQYAMGWALEDLRDTFRRQGSVLVHIAHDFETAVTADIARTYRGNLVKAMLLRRNAVKTSRMEGTLSRAVDLIGVISDEDAEAFSKLSPKRHPIVLRPGFDGVAATRSHLGPYTPKRVVIVGSFEWLAKQMNLRSFLDDAAPTLAAVGIGLDVIGSMPDDLRRELSERHDWVRIRGFVDDLESELKNYRLGLNIEQTGGGFKLKTLTYVNALLPVAALRASLTGVPAALAQHMLVAPDGGSLAVKIVDGIDAIDALHAMSASAAATAKQLFDWDRTGSEFASALERCYQARTSLQMTDSRRLHHRHQAALAR